MIGPETVNVDAALEAQMNAAKKKARADARRAKLPPYYCERHQREHFPAWHVAPGLTWDKMTPAERVNEGKANEYDWCKRFARGTQAAEAVKALRAILAPGDTVNCVLRSRSRSGMMRHISLLVGDSEISHLAAVVLDMHRDEHDGGIKIGGCGMDMGFQLVYLLSGDLFPDGFPCLGNHNAKGYCPWNGHSNGDRLYRKGRFHPGGGSYALRHRWL